MREARVRDLGDQQFQTSLESRLGMELARFARRRFKGMRQKRKLGEGLELAL